jgi:hypothetical protein
MFLFELTTLVEPLFSIAFPPIPGGDMLVEERIILPPRPSPPPVCNKECELQRLINLYQRLYAPK